MKMEHIIYGCYPSFFFTLIANILVVEKQIPLVCIMVSTRPVTIEKKKIRGLSGLKFLRKRLSNKFLLFQFLVGSIAPIAYSIYSILQGRKFYSLKKLCSKYRINYIESNNFNRDISKIDTVDVFISMCLDQRISETFINRVRRLCIKIHPSDLPNFGGVEPIIMLQLSPEIRMRVSIHKMTPQIDEGLVIYREYLERGMHNYFSLMKKNIKHVTDMFHTFYKNNWRNPSLNQLKQKYPYRSWPTKDELFEFEKKHSYLKVKDLFRWNI